MKSNLFISRPVMTTLVMLAILMFGVAAYRQLPVSDLPNVDFPTINVSANLPGASPETMAAAVATPLEREFSTIAGLDSMTSTSSQGRTSVTLQFNLNRDIDAAAQDVQAAIANTLRSLPADLPSPPSYNKSNPADSPILFIGLSSPTLPLSQLDEYAQTNLAQRISTISGVAQVQVYGSQKYAVRVQLDPNSLASRQIGIDEVTQAIRSGNSNMPAGTLYGKHNSYTLQTSGQLNSAPEYRRLIVSYRSGSPVRLQDVALVSDSVENDKAASWFNGPRAIMLAIQRQPGTNTVEVVDRIRALLPQIQEQLPAAVDLKIHYDRSESIRHSIGDVQFTLMLTVALVVMVIFLFLRNISATLIPSLALPMSIVGTFAAMYLLGYSLNNLSLMAITLSVGFVVDDAIVVLENIVRHMEMGKRPFQAAVDGTREISFTIVSMTLSLAAVFIPVLFMSGILGRLLHEFAVTIAVAILISGFVSLTLTPMLASRFVRASAHQQHGRFYRVTERGFDALLNGYKWSLAKTMHHRFVTFMVSMGVLAATVFLFIAIPKGFLPTEDIGILQVNMEAAQGIGFEELVKKQRQVAETVSSHPAVGSWMSSLGGGYGGAGNTGRMFVRLKERTERQHAEQIIQELRPQLAKIAGVRVFMQVPPPIRVGGRMSRTQYQFTLQSGDTKELYAQTIALQKKLEAFPELQDLNNDVEMSNPQVRVDIDRDKAAALGVTAQQVEDALYSAYGQRQVSTILAPNNQYRVVMELLPQYQQDPSALSMLYIRARDNKLVPLNSVATISRELGPLTVNHLGQLPSATISFNLKPGVALGQAVDRVYSVARETLPPTISTSFQGTAQVFESSLQGLGLLLLMAVLVIYIVLGILYESFIHPLTILSGLPSAGFGALLTLMIFKSDLNLYAFVGVIMLVGIVKKNAIMMIDFALDAQRHGAKDPAQAIYEGAIVRFRPIMMTTMAALMGTLPIALGYGAGGESRRPLGLAVVGGLVFSQVLTLYITPVYFVYLDQMQRRFGGFFGKRRKQAAEQVERDAAMVRGD